MKTDQEIQIRPPPRTFPQPRLRTEFTIIDSFRHVTSPSLNLNATSVDIGVTSAGLNATSADLNVTTASLNLDAGADD